MSRKSWSWAIALAAISRPTHAAPVFWDGRDAYTLFDRHLVNRNLFEQLDDQPYRFRGPWDRFAFAADTAIGTQQTFAHTVAQSRFHGYFLADVYAALVPFDGLDANLNVLFLNPSASDGYHVSSAAIPGLALHAHYPVASILGDTATIDVLGTDLGWVTVGRGLLLEQTPLEGAMGALSWRDWSLRYMYAGRALYDDDDFITTSLTAFDRLATLTLLDWHKKELPGGAQATDATPSTSVYYVSGSLDVPLGRGFRIAGEYAGRSDRKIRSGWLVRGDYLSRELSWLSVHTGGEFRWYGRHFGPRDQLLAPSWVWSTPYQQDVYVTNPFEYYALSPYYDQWSGTLMIETRLRVTQHLQLVGDGEEWLRVAVAERGVNPRIILPDGFSAPGRKLDFFYRAGVSFLPWSSCPHRVSTFVTNKQVQSGLAPSTPVVQRFQPGTYWVLSFEAFL